MPIPYALNYRCLPATLLSGLLLMNAAGALEVNITGQLAEVEVMHQNKPVTIQRNQNPDNTVNPDYAKTSRPCPPFCIQPAILAPGVETIAELEILSYLEKMSWGEPFVVIDSRTPNWVVKGTIPGSVNIPWTHFTLDAGANVLKIQEILTTQFGVKEQDELLNFENAKTLVMFCNGPWCGQSSTSIHTLLKLGYPPHKIKWYRGGMQAWEMLGLTTVTEEK